MKISKLTLVAVLSSAPMAVLADSRVDFGISVEAPAPGVVVATPPPPMASEIISPAPGPNFVWVGGHWKWRGRWRGWAWVRGRWAQRPYANAEWIAGHWGPAPGGWVWIEGQWVAPQPPVSQAYVVGSAPPPPIFETVYPAPGPDYFWIGGSWAWHGRWIWSPGHYERHPHFHPGAGWVNGHWDRRGGGYIWIGGHWT
jgi:hypothetical protein